MALREVAEAHLVSRGEDKGLTAISRGELFGGEKGERSQPLNLPSDNPLLGPRNSRPKLKRASQDRRRAQLNSENSLRSRSNRLPLSPWRTTNIGMPWKANPPAHLSRALWLQRKEGGPDAGRIVSSSICTERTIQIEPEAPRSKHVFEINSSPPQRTRGWIPAYPNGQ